MHAWVALLLVRPSFLLPLLSDTFTPLSLSLEASDALPLCCADSRTFSEVVAEAKAAGYTEPDPRDDLAGMDVARKVTILAR
jgi:hypothetical protein